MKNIFNNKTQKMSNDKMLEFLDEQFTSKPCRILKLRFYYKEELLSSSTSIQELQEKIQKNNESISSLV